MVKQKVLIKKALEECVKTFTVLRHKDTTPNKSSTATRQGYFGKKISKSTYIIAEEKNMPSHKPMNDRLTLILGANVSGKCKINPLLVYHSDKPRAFKAHTVLKENL